MEPALHLPPADADKKRMEAPGILDRACGEVDVESEVHDSLAMLAELYAYNHWFYGRLHPFLHGSICDVGCGTGNFIRFLLNHRLVVGIEPYAASLVMARERFRDHRNVRFTQAWLSDCPNEEAPAGSFDTVVCLRVLDAMEDDLDALRRMGRLCRHGGNVVIVAAAHMSAYGELDQALGHLRRYNRRTLGRVFEAAGLRVTHSFYINALGLFGWLWQSRVQRRKRIPAGGARLLNRLVPFLDAFERVFHPPFGQSIVMVGTPAE